MKKEEIKKKIKEGIKEINIQDIFKPGWKVDKAKIKYIVRKKSQIEDLKYFLEVDSRVTTQFTSGSLKNSHYNFTIECQKGNVYIGIEDNSNMNTDEARKTITIEYNPQKVDLFTELNYLSFLKEIDLHRRYILYLDLAYDMYVNISDIRYKKRRKNEYRALHEHEQLETIYLKRFGTNNATRIYDKTKEMNADKNNDLDEETGEIKKEKYYGDCTRYEIRIKPENKAEQLMFNLTDPFSIQNLVKLHELWLDDGTEEKTLKEIETNHTGSEFLYLMAFHLGYEEKIKNKNTRKKHKELYEEIKKSFSSSEQENDIFKTYDTDHMQITIKNYLKDITLNQEMQSKLLTNKIIDVQEKYKKY